jgi:hypothetical protein
VPAMPEPAHGLRSSPEPAWTVAGKQEKLVRDGYQGVWSSLFFLMDGIETKAAFVATPHARNVLRTERVV